MIPELRNKLIATGVQVVTGSLLPQHAVETIRDDEWVRNLPDDALAALLEETDQYWREMADVAVQRPESVRIYPELMTVAAETRLKAIGPFRRGVTPEDKPAFDARMDRWITTLSHCLLAKGMVLLLLPHPQAAWETFTQAGILARALPDRGHLRYREVLWACYGQREATSPGTIHLPTTWNSITIYCFWDGVVATMLLGSPDGEFSLERAFQQLEQARLIAVELNDHNRLAKALIQLAVLFDTVGDVEQAEQYCLMVDLVPCSPLYRARRDEVLGRIRVHQRRYDEAIQLLQGAAASYDITHWAVDDLSTGLLMQHFYQTLRTPAPDDGGPITKAEALQAAQLFVKHLTAEQIVDYCDRRLATLMDTQQDEERVLCFRLGRVNAQAAAGDLEPAIDTVRDVQRRLRSLSGRRAATLAAQVAQTLPLLEFKAEAAPPIDYDAHPFDHLYYWAPFILVGDWK